MKSYGLVIDESLQAPKPFQSAHLTSPSPKDHFPKLPQLDSNTQSYSTVVEQAITTKDRPLLKEIIADSDSKTTRNTLAAIATDKVAALLSLLEEFIDEDSRNTIQYCAWLKELIRQHMGLLLSGQDNRAVVSRLIRFVQRRAEDRAQLLEVRAGLQRQGAVVKSREFKAKFNYIQNQEKENEEVPKEDMDMQGEEFDMEDEMLDEFDD